MDIRKLQRAIVDGLEDVKANDIQVFNTEHLSPLFERVIIASGTSNRQTKALATSVREAVKAKGMEVLRTEGGDNGEWIIVDCGPAVAHIMQPAIRQYYRLEEIWGEKPVRMKIDGGLRGLPKAAGAAAVDDAPGPAPRPAAGATGSAARKAAPKPGAKAAAKAAAKPAAPRPSGRRTGGARSAAGDSAPPAPRKRAAAPRSAAAVGSGGARTRPAAKAPRRG